MQSNERGGKRERGGREREGGVWGGESPGRRQSREGYWQVHTDEVERIKKRERTSSEQQETVVYFFAVGFDFIKAGAEKYSFT